MKKLMILFGAALLLSSCSRYYVSTLESPTAKKSEETGIFTFENDTLAVTYSFRGENAPMNIEVFNKLSTPLFIDWQKSALIKGDQAISFSGKNISINGNLSGNAMDFSRNLTFYDANLKGSATLPDNISFIPPKSKVSKTPLNLAQQHNYKALPDTAFKKSYIMLSEGSGFWAQSATFNPENSPLSFKSYLTFYTEDDNKKNSFALVQDFYLSSLVKCYVKPQTLSLLEQNPGNIFYNAESTGYGKTMTGIATIGAAGAIVAAGAAAESSTKYKPKYN